jgi:hypothetical protein
MIITPGYFVAVLMIEKHILPNFMLLKINAYINATLNLILFTLKIISVESRLI